MSRPFLQPRKEDKGTNIQSGTHLCQGHRNVKTFSVIDLVVEWVIAQFELNKFHNYKKSFDKVFHKVDKITLICKDVIRMKCKIILTKETVDNKFLFLITKSHIIATADCHELRLFLCVNTIFLSLHFLIYIVYFIYSVV